jgi:hypothetical protein
MKRRLVILATTVVMTLGFVILKPIAFQAAFDKQRSRQELETMKGILKTTLNYALKRMDTRPADARWVGFGGIGGGVQGFYLQGQGAVFVIPMSTLRSHGHGVYAIGGSGDAVGVGIIEDAMLAEGESIEVLTQQAEELREVLEEQERSSGQRAEAAKKRMELQKARAEKAKQKLEQRRAAAQKQREALQGRVEQVKVSLKDTLASHGDSLTIVRPAEWVTFVIAGDRGGFGLLEERGDDDVCHVLAVQKSTVTDLKAGKISREEFDRRVSEYSY